MIKDLEQVDNTILKHFIIADKAWLYYYNPTIKQQSSEWKHPFSPIPNKPKTGKLVGKVMTIIVNYYERIVYQHAVEPGTTVNDSYYTNILQTMAQHVKSKSSLLRNGFLLPDDNTRPHIALCVLDVSQQNSVKILLHPPYSPNLTPCDFCFLNLRNHYESTVLQATKHV
ncbi:histone-lysine N-methyltransferase SETMAR [Trichonephila clavipes]|nr:histone-lysine N-methyltransferase SETMAR [Trichonephila clavipes]